MVAQLMPLLGGINKSKLEPKVDFDQNQDEGAKEETSLAAH